MTTTTTWLREQYGPRRRLVCAIDGLQHLVWQDDGTGVPPTRAARGSPDVTDLVALEAPQSELSWGLDIGEMSVKPSAVTLGFRDVADPTAATVKFFSRLFAPGRHASSAQKSAHLARTNSLTCYVDSTAATLNTKENLTTKSWPTSGLAYTARETFRYSGLNGAQFTGCTRGLWSCLDLSGAAGWAPTYKVPDYSASAVGAMGIEISTVPYTWIGRRIALYVVAYDATLGAWRTNVGGAIDGDLAFVGRIQSIRWYGERGVWELGCEHILADLEQKIASGMPSSAQLYGLNMSGPQGTSFTIGTWPSGTGLWTGNVVSYRPTLGIYWRPDDLAKELEGLLRAHTSPFVFDLVRGPSGHFELRLFNRGYSGLGSADYQFFLDANSDWEGWGSAFTALQGYPSHPWRALGFTSWEYNVDVDGGSTHTFVAELPPATAYHPTDYAVNGQKLGATVLNASDKTPIWDASQSDYDGPRAAVEIRNVVLPISPNDASNERVSHHAYYTAISTQSFVNSSGVCGYLSLYQGIGGPWTVLDQTAMFIPKYAYAAQREGEEAVTIRNIWIPSYWDSGGRARGPFELLLYPLLSTGTTDANDATYDQLPLELSAAMAVSLVDKQSFLDADALLANEPLAQRRAYVIGDGISWMDLLIRECKLFGHVLCWDTYQKKLALRSAYAHLLDTQTETISDSNSIDAMEFPDADMTDATVINRWEMSILYDRRTGKFKRPIIVEDEDSIQQLRVAKTVKLEHPGVWLADGTIATVEGLVGSLFRQNRFCWRYPWQVVTRTLAPTLFNRVSIGDCVLFTSSRMPDPYGSGTATTSCIAFVTNLEWDLRAWTGRATLLLYSGFDASMITPWAWAAVISSWDSGTKRLTLVAKTWGGASDVDDAAAALAGHYVDIIERAPASPTAPQTWTGLLVASDYETDGANILTLDAGTTLTGWDAAVQYIVLPSGYGSVTATQRATNAYHASVNGLLGGSAPAHRYG